MMTDREVQLAIIKGLGAIHKALTGQPLRLDVETEAGTLTIIEPFYEPPSAIKYARTELKVMEGDRIERDYEETAAGNVLTGGRLIRATGEVFPVPLPPRDPSAGIEGTSQSSL